MPAAEEAPANRSSASNPSVGEVVGPARTTRRVVFISTGTPKPATRSISPSAVRKLFTRALGEAARDDEPRPELARAGELEDRLDRLLAGSIYEGAGVHDNKVRLAGVLRSLVAARDQTADQLLRVDLILRTAERGDPEALVHLRSVPMP